MAVLIAFLACTGARPATAQQRNEQLRVGLRLFVIEMRHYGPDEKAFERLASFVLAWSSGADRVIAIDSTQGFARELVGRGQAPDETHIRGELQRLRDNIANAPDINSTLTAISRHIESHGVYAEGVFESCPTNPDRCPPGANTIEIVLAAQQYNQTAEFNGMIEFPSPSCLEKRRFVDPQKLTRPRNLINGMQQVVRLVIATDVIGQNGTDTSPQIVDLFHNLATRQGAEYLGTVSVLPGARQLRRPRQSPTLSGDCVLSKRTWPSLPPEPKRAEASSDTGKQPPGSPPRPSGQAKQQPPEPAKQSPAPAPAPKVDTPPASVPPTQLATPLQPPPAPSPPAASEAQTVPTQRAEPEPRPPALAPGSAAPTPRRPEPPAPARTGTSAPRISFENIASGSRPAPSPTVPANPPALAVPASNPPASALATQLPTLAPKGAVLTVKWRLPAGATLNLTRSGTVTGAKNVPLEDLPLHPGTAHSGLHIREFLFPATSTGGRVQVKLVVEGTCPRGNPIRLMLEQQTPDIRWRASGRQYVGRKETSLPLKCVATALQPFGRVQLDPANATLEFWQ
jgi:hypothetical protein